MCSGEAFRFFGTTKSQVAAVQPGDRAAPVQGAASQSGIRRNAFEDSSVREDVFARHIPRRLAQLLPLRDMGLSAATSVREARAAALQAAGRLRILLRTWRSFPGDR